jgi:hypothetical protein
MRWLRLYDDTINDPKILKLPEAMRWHWIAMLCITSKYEGSLPALDDIAIQLRVTAAKATEIISVLLKAGLLDKTETGFVPHNWNGRQYKSDVSTNRVKRFRNAKRNVAVTPPETDTEADTETDNSEANASGAEAPVDFRKKLFNEGLSKLATMTGKGPDACRSFVGKCLQAASDDAVTVLGLIEEAERNRVVDPSAWIRARLPTTGPPGKPLTEFQIRQRQTESIRNELENFATGSSSRGQENPRLLPGHSSERSAAVRGGFGGELVDVSPRGRRESG